VKVTGFHHVSVNTNGVEVDAVAAFYRDLFGLADRPRPEIPGVPGHWHVVGDQELHVVGAPPGDGPIHPTGPHFCVLVDDLDAATAELETRGIPYERAVQGESTVQIWINDPAGNTIELQQDR